MSQTDKHGTSLLSLSQAAEKLGYDAEGLRGSAGSLAQITTPFIAHLRIDGVLEHYVVVERLRRSSVYVMDPRAGHSVSWSLAEFINSWTGHALTVRPSSNAGRFPEYLAKNLFARSWTVLGENWRSLTLCTALALAVSGIRYVPVLAIKFLLDADTRDHTDTLVLLLVGVSCFSMLEVGLDYVRQVLLMRVGLRIQAKLSESFISRLFRLPYSIVESLRQGELSARLDDIARVRSLLTSDLSQALVEGLTVVIGFAILAKLSGPLAFIVALLSLAIYGVLVLSAAETRGRARELVEGSANVTASAVEVFGAIRAIRQFAADHTAVGHVMKMLDKAFERRWAAAHWSMGISTIVTLLARTAFVAALAISGVALVQRTDSVGIIIGALFVSSYLLSSVITMGRRIQQMLDSRIAIERLCEITEFPYVAVGQKRQVFHPPSDQGLVFRDVVFRYGAREPVIDGFSLNCAAGTITVLLGLNGSGKTTLLDLAQGLYPIESGTIHANGIQVHQLALHLRAKLIGVVAQDNPVFSGSLAANVAFGDSRPDLPRVANAVSLAGLSTLVSSERQGVHMLLGERGAALSGGQRQMLGLARALYNDPQILLLDEPSSSLDSVALATLRGLLPLLRAQRKTILIVSHQPWALAIADAACILENGKARLTSPAKAGEQYDAGEFIPDHGPCTMSGALSELQGPCQSSRP